MELNEELQAIQKGEKGETMKKILNTLVMYGEAFGAKRMVKLTGAMNHCVIATGTITWKPVFNLMQKLIDEGALPKTTFTTDPRGFEKGIPATLLQKILFKVLFGQQKRLEKEFKDMGIKDQNAYTCTCYMPEVGNVPNRGDVLGWAESSAVSFANSVIGAKCNRNSGVMEIMASILGYVPEFGFLTSEGRKADWVIEIKTSKKPEAQILGSAIGLKVIDQVPYIKGLDKWIGTELNNSAKDFLKDMGAAAASNGAVGLYHVDKLTPEAKDEGTKLIKKDAKTLVIDDEYLKKTYESYPNIWKNPNGKPKLAFVGCPHFSFDQLKEWHGYFFEGLKKHNRSKLIVKTVVTTSPDVLDRFKKECPELMADFKKMGVTVGTICGLSYCANPLIRGVNIMTCSNKLRTYSHSRFYEQDKFIDILTGGEQ